MPRKKIEEKEVELSLEELAEKYVAAKEGVKKYNEDIKLGDKIKKVMLAQGKMSFGCGNIELTITQSSNDCVDQDKAIEILEEAIDKKYLKECVKTVKVLDEDAVQNLIYKGILPAKILEKALVHRPPTSRLNYKIIKG